MKKWTWDNVLEEGEEVETVVTGKWRWGTIETLIFKHGGKHWGVTYEVHTQDGIQRYGPPEVFAVEKRERTITEWVRSTPG